MSERKRRVYRAVITEAPDGPVPRWVYNQWGRFGRDEPELLHEQRSRQLTAVGAGVVTIDPFDEDPDTSIGQGLLASFKVGQSRTYWARANADRKARLWRVHGCTVRIDVSEPIVWAEGEALAALLGEVPVNPKREDS